nr:uncharacterized protein LOC112418543 [Ipomoea batatas]
MAVWPLVGNRATPIDGAEKEYEDSSEPVVEELEDSLEIVGSLTPFEEEQAPKVELKPLPSSLRLEGRKKDELPIDDTFRGETLLAVNTSVPWFANIVNFLASGYIPKDFDYNKKKRFVHDVREYFWDEPLLFKRGPDGIMPPRQKKKSVAQRQPPAEQVPDTPLHDPKNFERFQFFSQRQIFRPYVLSLDVADEFGIRQ